MHKTVVLNIVGLTPKLLGAATPELSRWSSGARQARIRSAFPAVTCTAQADYLTGESPARHGIVGNGWYSREDCEVRFWKQANPLVQAPKIWEAARAVDSAFTCANLFWWFNMYSTVDYAVTPRPMYPADGRKLPDVYATPATLRDELQAALGQFPLFEFWGPRASIRCSEWIAASARHVEGAFNPTLTLVYLPHLDYNLQRLGVSDPAIEQDLRAIDRVAGDLIRFYEDRGARVIVLSEYGLTDVATPVHPNRMLRERGLLAVRHEQGREALDPGASAAFAVADHQVAHVYVNDRTRLPAVRQWLEHLPGVDRVLGAGRAGGRAPEPSARRRPRRRGRAGRLVHLLLLARRPARARLRAHGRHPPQARLRPGRAVPRSSHPAAGADRGLEAAEAQARPARAARRDPARSHAGPRLARASDRLDR